MKQLRINVQCAHSAERIKKALVDLGYVVEATCSDKGYHLTTISIFGIL